ncbi:MAG: D-TA family PLP-dependent enzyme [Planctomycetaceae bacterium]|jgi:D-threonine aldolase|nr:D-TA family PLP-dependent enzyme [Planctomycetaceae bacterium]
MTACNFKIQDTSSIVSPGLVVFREVMNENLAEMLREAGDVTRLRPHCKTHKMEAVTKIQLGMGITKHKCATFAEAEMLAAAGVKDILLGYNLVGPNIRRAVDFVTRYNDVQFIATADHEAPVRQLSQAMSAANQSIELLLDLDSGQHRTGITPGETATQIYQLFDDLPGITPGGIHLYDGQNHQTDLESRRQAVMSCWQLASNFRDQLESEGLSVPRIVAGGTGSFPVYASISDPALELSPGTNTFFDNNYGKMFPDLQYIPAARILTRVISRPTEETITVDLGYKACASDPDVTKRVVFPDLPNAEPILQNEEHLVLRLENASDFLPGDELLAIPGHICPTSALHKSAYVIEDGQVSENWEVSSRDRWLTI